MSAPYSGFPFFQSQSQSLFPSSLESVSGLPSDFSLPDTPVSALQRSDAVLPRASRFEGLRVRIPETSPVDESGSYGSGSYVLGRREPIPPSQPRHWNGNFRIDSQRDVSASADTVPPPSSSVDPFVTPEQSPRSHPAAPPPILRLPPSSYSARRARRRHDSTLRLPGEAMPIRHRWSEYRTSTSGRATLRARSERIGLPLVFTTQYSSLSSRRIADSDPDSISLSPTHSDSDDSIGSMWE